MSIWGSTSNSSGGVIGSGGGNTGTGGGVSSVNGDPGPDVTLTPANIGAASAVHDHPDLPAFNTDLAMLYQIAKL